MHLPWRSMRWLALGMSTLGVARVAAASPAYPAVVAREWGLVQAPDCTICHATDSGGTGTVVTYFGRQMQAFGLTANNEASLVEALALDKSQRTDSDRSGTSDYDDLVAGRSPNAGPGPGDAAPERPLHGCASIAAPREAGRGGVVGLTGLTLLTLALRRIRRAARPRGVRSSPRWHAVSSRSSR